MKKAVFLIIICLFILPCVYAFDGFYDYDFDEGKKPFRFNNRIVEIGFNAGINVSNDFLSIGQIFSETLVLNIDELQKGFRMNLGADLSPFYLNINTGTWGFGFFTNVDAVGAFGLSGNLLSFNNAIRDRSDVAGAVFASAGINTFFPIQKFRVKFNTAMFYPVIYIEPRNVSYTFTNTIDGNFIMNIGYDLLVYSAFPINEFPESFILSARPGFDFTLGIEYPLSDAIRLNRALPSYLDFDIGLDFINIPIVPSTLTSYMRMFGLIGSLDPVDLEGFLETFNDFQNNTDYENNGNKRVERPFKMIAWADWRPFLNRELFTVTPSLGFSINEIYSNPVALEIGIAAKLSLANIFNPSIGISYEDRLWRNVFNLALNFRAIELNFGAELQAQSFLKSWNSGLGVNVGVKMGW